MGDWVLGNSKLFRTKLHMSVSAIGVEGQLLYLYSV